MTSQETFNKFNTLYDLTYPKVLKYVICHCNNISDVEDLLQNIYYEVFKKTKKINHESYVLGIAKNKVNEFYRKKYKTQQISFNEELELIESEIDVSKDIQLHLDVEEIWNFLKSKPVIISKIFYLYFYLDLTIQEIADELNLNQSNVKNHLYRTLKELRKREEIL